MSISSISGGSSTLQSYLQKLNNSSSISKEDLSTIQSQLDDSAASSKLSSLISSFDKVDINGDGKIDTEEFQTYTKQAGIKGEINPGNATPPELTKDELTEMINDSSESGETDDLLSSLIESFDDADTDGNGAVSDTEFRSFADANGFKPPERGDGPPPPPPPSSSSTDEDDDEDDSETTTSSASTSSSSESIGALLSKYINNLSFSDEDLNSLLQDLSA